MKKSKHPFLIFSILLLFTHCKKQESFTIKSISEKNQVKTGQSIISSQKNSSTTDSEVFPSTAAEIFQGIDPVLLQTLVSTQSEELAPLIEQLSLQVCDYMSTRYGIDINDGTWNVPSENVAVGLFFAVAESDYLFPESLNSSGGKIKKTSMVMLDSDESCFYAVLSGLFGIGSIESIINDFRRGVSANTVVKTLKFAGRRVATVFSVGLAVYQLGDCLGWW